MTSNKIKPAQVVRDLSNGELRSIVVEIREWNQTGLTDGVHLATLTADLISDTGLTDDSTLWRIAEGLVLQEAAARWLELTSEGV